MNHEVAQKQPRSKRSHNANAPEDIAAVEKVGFFTCPRAKLISE